MNAETITTYSPPKGSERRHARLSYFIPLVAFVALAIVLGWGLTRDPRTLPSTLIGKPAPQFALPAVKGRTLGLSTADLIGQVSLVNVFASWCLECRAEHPLLMQLQATDDFPIYGLNYKDRPDDAQKWLDAYGDPYARTGADIDGRAGIEWGVYGVPETFVITRDGHVAYKHIGPLTPVVLEKTILPLVWSLKESTPAQPANSGAPIL